MSPGLMPIWLKRTKSSSKSDIHHSFRTEAETALFLRSSFLLKKRTFPLSAFFVFPSPERYFRGGFCGERSGGWEKNNFFPPPVFSVFGRWSASLSACQKRGGGGERRRRWKEESGTAARGYYSEGTEQDEAVFSRAMESRCGKKKDEGGTGMILNTGNRTDIPAFYSAWLCNRIRAGFVCVRNPFHPSCVTRYRMDPELVDVLMFCTKNPAPALEYLSEFGIFRQLWFVTITPYGREIEPGVPEKREVIRSFRELSSQIGRKCVCWRYDPVFLSDRYSIAFHCSAFEKMASALSGAVEYCVVSFIDLYEKTRRNFSSVRAVTPEE